MDQSLVRLETQMAVLGRRIESAARQSTTFRRMDRAAYLIARTLDENGPSSVNELARALGLDGSTVTRQVAAMEARRHATRKSHPADGRAWVISLTAPGRREMQAISAVRRQRFAEWLGEWSESDIDAFGRLLQRFNDSMGTDGAGGTSGSDGGAAADEPVAATHRRTEHRQSVLHARRSR